MAERPKDAADVRFPHPRRARQRKRTVAAYTRKTRLECCHPEDGRDHRAYLEVMKRTTHVALVILTAASLYGQTKLADFKEMAGCWERRDDTKKLLISEQWMAPPGTSILGIGRTVKEGKTIGWEYMRIEERTDGVYFVSRPHENTDETAFKLIESKNGRFVFENKEHDFPQRVIYTTRRSSLKGRIEGLSNG